MKGIFHRKKEGGVEIAVEQRLRREVLGDTWQDCQGNEWIYESPATLTGPIQSGPAGKQESADQ